MKNTQMNWVVKILNQYGSISRNYAIQNYCSRLGAVIEKLNKSGWKIEGHYEKNGMGKDYIIYTHNPKHDWKTTREIIGFILFLAVVVAGFVIGFKLI